MKLTTFHIICYLLAFAAITSCGTSKSSIISQPDTPVKVSTSEHLVRLTAELDTLLESDTKYEVIAGDINFADGPLWIKDQNALIFSEVGNNKILKWSSAVGIQDYILTSGYTGDFKKETLHGSRGLALDTEGNLLICQQGDLVVSIMAATLALPKPKFLPLFNTFLKKELYGPTDIDVDEVGNVYFVDPAPVGFDFDNKEKYQLPFSGVYRQERTGKMHIEEDAISVPSGITIAPDQTHIIIANGDPKKAYWVRHDIGVNGCIGKSGTIYNATKNVKRKKGLPDGLEYHKDGYLFATGPEGIWIFNPEYQVIGKILTPSIATDCTFDTAFQFLYITTEKELLRVKLKS